MRARIRVAPLLPGRQALARAPTVVRDDQAGARYPLSAITVVLPTTPCAPDSSQAGQSPAIARHWSAGDNDPEATPGRSRGRAPASVTTW